uniref:Uncharacterized protein n=1 Tax=Parascaris univalens TaxID=6257 RepID=A0A915AZ70_PARUN
MKTRVDAVEEVLLDEELAHLSCEQDLKDRNDEQRDIVMGKNETATSIIPTCATKLTLYSPMFLFLWSAVVTDSLAESISQDAEQQESEVTNGSGSSDHIDDKLEGEESQELERIEIEHEELPSFNEEGKRDEFDQEQVLGHIPEVGSDARNSRKPEQYSPMFM